MTPERWERLNQLFHSALAVEPGARETFLAAARAEEPDLGADLVRLLAAHAREGGLIERPAIASAEGWLEGEDVGATGRRIGAYRVLREIGRGGMGCVYLAERADGAFEHRVALKLIKRGMDTDQVLARFRAERQILASLDHPNIAHLLDGGSTEERLPYFAMEYIDGQPIDVFADARRLPVKQRLELFLHVCDAVTYAHGRGVIHRDIKPLNILVTPLEVPKLLDFGIAKVLHESADEPTTVTELRLLTPEYASPEQVEGRHATIASDVYSLGVVLYELLTGRSPYRIANRSPQEVATAVCTTEPERPSRAARDAAAPARPRRRAGLGADHVAARGLATAAQLRRLLRGDLDTIVLTALRKEPARRYPSAAALADDVRRHLGARPVLARADSFAYRAGKFVRRNRAAVAVGALALVAMGTAAAMGTALSRRGERDDPSLIAAHALAPRDRILVADFVDRTGDTTLTAAITEAFRIDLAQSPVVRVLTPRQVRASLERMQRRPDVTLDDSLAREVAVREGVKAFVTGGVARLAGRYTVSVQVVSAEAGEALAAVRETAPDSLQLLGAVERASKAIRHRIGESLAAIRAMPPLMRVTTASLPALRQYSEGQRLFRAGERTRGIQHYQAAVALDSGFASAHLGLYMAYGATGAAGLAFAAADRALAHQDRLPFLERGFLVGSRAYGRQDYRTAAEAYTRVLERYPDNVAALNNLALVYRDQREFPAAESLFRRAAGIDSTIANLYFGVHDVEVLQGKFAESRRTLDLIARRFPANPELLTEELQDAAARQDWGAAERAARTRFAQARQDTMELVDPAEALAGIWMAEGRLREAEGQWRLQLRLSAVSGAWGRHVFGLLQLAWLELRYRGVPARAAALVDSALAATPLDSLLPGDRRYDELARFYAAAGQPGRARQLLAAAVANDSALGRVSLAERSWTQGLLALAQGRPAEAEAELGRAAATHPCEICPLPDLGRAHEAAGHPAAAVAAYERYLATPWLWRYEPDAVELGWITKRLAELYEARGDRGRAMETYRRLLATWRNADSELRPALADVRRRLLELGEKG
jgi:serine/threonine protein kinase/TolB-like protein